MFFVSKAEATASERLEDVLVIAEAIRHMAPDPGDEATRVGLVHVALQRLACPDAPIPPDCLGRALQEARGCSILTSRVTGADHARMASLALSAIAGDLPDPSGGARLVFAHNAEIPVLNAFSPIALLGGFVFFKSRPPI